MLRVRVLGALEVELDGALIDSPASQRPWSLFAYLALSGRPVSRQELATRFWPDVLDQSARASLRSALWTLRRQLGPAVHVAANRVELTHPDGVWVDVREFDRLAVRAPERALALCRGTLLEGVADEWALLARDRHRANVIELLELLAVAAHEHGDGARSLALTRRQVQEDPLDEAANRRLIERLDAAGDRAGAVRTYQSLAARLRRELAVAPSAATRELGARLRPQPAPVAASPRPRAPAPPALIGRERELIELRTIWRDVGASLSGAVVVMRGEAGIGKTRLATELAHHVVAGGARATIGATLDLGSPAPLGVWAELLAELLPTMDAPPPDAAWPGELSALVPGLPEHFPPVNPVAAVAPDLQRTRLFEAVVGALQWGLRGGPLLLVLEDLHAADAASLELTGYAARRLARRPVMLLLTRRERPRQADADTLEQALRARGLLTCEVELGPLDARGVSALASTIGALSPQDVARVVALADGNALLAVESARALRSAAGVTPTLRGSVLSSLRRLQDDGRTLVDLLAVASRPIAAAELRALAIPRPEQSTESAIDTGLLHTGDARLGFRHALLRDAVYDAIAAPRRAALHHRWAAALSGAAHARTPAGAAEIARHLRLADADAEAVPFLAQAAEGARAIGALAAAVGYLEEALEIDPGRADLWLALGEAEAWRHRREAAEHAFARALELAGPEHPLQAARALLERARAFHGPLCVPRTVLDSSARALELLGACPDALAERQEALGDKAWSEAVAGDVGAAEALIDELEATVAPGDELAAYHVSHARALALMRRGRFVESYAPSIAGGEAIDRAGRPDLAYGCWANAAGAANAAGDPDQALAFLARGLQAVEGHGLAALELQMHGCRAFVLCRAGRRAEALAAAETQRVIAEALGDAELSAFSAHDRGMVALELGDHVGAAAALSDALAVSGRLSRPLTRLACAEALARGGAPELAAEQLRAAVLEPMRPSDFPAALVPRMAGVQGLIALARGDRPAAERHLQEAIAGWSRLVAQALESSTLVTVLADLGRPVVGLIEPERELRRARATLAAARASALPLPDQGDEHAVVS